MNFSTACTKANTALSINADENKKYHPTFIKLLKACKALHFYSAKTKLAKFDNRSPDFVVYAGDDRGQAAGVVEIKTKKDRAVDFQQDDIVEVIRYGQCILSTQPFRDHATVCLFNFKIIRFFQVFRGTSKIRTTRSVAREHVIALLYAYLMGTKAAHGMRTITIEG